MKPGRVLDFRLDVKVPKDDGDYSGNLTFRTVYEVKRLYTFYCENILLHTYTFN